MTALPPAAIAQPAPAVKSLPTLRRSAPINVAEFEAHAAVHLQKQVYDYYRSGANDEETLRDNIAAYQRLLLRPRVMVDVSRMDLTTTVLGATIASPICIAPTAMQRMAHVDGEIASARAAAACNTLFCLSSLSTTNLVDVGASVPDSLRWFQLYIYNDRTVTMNLIRQAEESGYKAIAITVDTPFIGTREADVRNGFALPAHLSLANFVSREKSKAIVTEQQSNASGLAEYTKSLFDRSITWKDIAWVKTQTRLPIVLKGVLTGEDARLAVEAGCSGIIVSNHGARQVDTVPATIEALPEVLAAVDGRCEVYIDGGIRRGTDVLKALALGARAVFVGRPVLWGLAYAGEEGVRAVWNILHTELADAMALCGIPNLASITRNFVTTRDAMRPKL